jgi:hypothetical protein
MAGRTVGCAVHPSFLRVNDVTKFRILFLGELWWVCLHDVKKNTHHLLSSFATEGEALAEVRRLKLEDDGDRVEGGPRHYQA